MNQQLYLVSPAGGEPRLVTAGGKVNNWFSGWSHDGRLLALSSNRRDPAAMDSWVYDPAGRRDAAHRREPRASAG